jgi:hypothetical protein
MGFQTYLATKARSWQWVAALSAAGVPLINDWQDWSLNQNDEEPTPDQWRLHAEKCLSSAASAQICLLYLQRNTVAFGGLLECGATLGRPDGWAYVVSDDGVPPFLANHPRVRVFPKLSDAIRAICAQRDASQARAAA